METIPTFVKNVFTSICRSDYMRFPRAMCAQYGSTLPHAVKLVVRNGHAIWLDFNKTEEHLEGIQRFFQLLNITGGETLLFEHTGEFQFKVHIFDMHSSEIKYPRMHGTDPDFEGMYLVV
ncbi:B3 domain-containing transcription factor VRN1-like [Apium graveolens]|uniref:B3 domain-containing transcription factor VRN1-like n=1 Tax=Apium graveolens TaxID=4045 RepID=UPI003D798642